MFNSDLQGLRKEAEGKLNALINDYNTLNGELTPQIEELTQKKGAKAPEVVELTKKLDASKATCDQAKAWLRKIRNRINRVGRHPFSNPLNVWHADELNCKQRRNTARKVTFNHK
ncbi:MAG: hypothetical protein KGL39_54775 [Patescibacteria group bacterium]|nr:hypothetical protein [Patescibacteria group bacterium]